MAVFPIIVSERRPILVIWKQILIENVIVNNIVVLFFSLLKYLTTYDNMRCRKHRPTLRRIPLYPRIICFLELFKWEPQYLLPIFSIVTYIVMIAAVRNLVSKIIDLFFHNFVHRFHLEAPIYVFKLHV